MSRFPILFRGLLTGALLCAASPGLARGGQDDDEGLARKLLAAAEKYSDLQEVTAKYGRRAEIALTILQDEQARTNVVAEIRDMQSMIAAFPQNRRWWLADQQASRPFRRKQDR